MRHFATKSWLLPVLVATSSFAGEWYEDELTAGFRRLPDGAVEWKGERPERVRVGGVERRYWDRSYSFCLSSPTQYFGKTIAIAFQAKGYGKLTAAYHWGGQRAPTVHVVDSPLQPDRDMPFRSIFGPVPTNAEVRINVQTEGGADMTFPVFLVADSVPVVRAKKPLPNADWPAGKLPKGYAEGRHLPLPPGEADLAPLAETWTTGLMASQLGQATDGSLGSKEYAPFVLSFPQPVTVTGFRWTLPPAVASVWADTTGDGRYDTCLYANWNGYAFSTWRDLREYVWLVERFEKPTRVSRVLVCGEANEFELTGPVAEAEKLSASAVFRPASRPLAVGAPLARQPAPPSVENQYWYGFCLEPWMFGMQGRMARYFEKGTPPGDIEDWPAWQKLAADFHELHANFVLLFPPSVFVMPLGVKPRGTYPHPLLWPSDVWYCNQTNDLLASFNRACHKEGFRNFVIPRQWSFKTNEIAEVKQVVLAREIAERGSDGVPVCYDEQYAYLRIIPKLDQESEKSDFLKWCCRTNMPTGELGIRLAYLYGAKKMSDWMSAIKAAQVKANPEAVTFGGFAGCDHWTERVMHYVSGSDFWGWEGRCDVIGGDGTYFGLSAARQGANFGTMRPYVETAVHVSCTPKRRAMATVNFNWGTEWLEKENRLKNPLVYDDFPNMAHKAGALATYFAKGEFLNFWRYNFMDMKGPKTRAAVKAAGYMTQVLGSWGGKKAEIPKDVLLLRSRTSEDWWSLMQYMPAKCERRAYEKERSWGHSLFFWTAARLVERATPFEIYQTQRVDAWKDIAAKYKVIVLPFAYSLSDEESAALKAAARTGVKIVVLGGDEAGTVDGIGERRERNALDGIPIERFRIEDASVPATRAQAAAFRKLLDKVLPQPSLTIETEPGHDVQAFMLSVSKREKLLMVANWSERTTRANLRLALPRGAYSLEVCDGECVRGGTVGGKATFGPEDAADIRLDLKREDVLLLRVRPSSGLHPSNWF